MVTPVYCEKPHKAASCIFVEMNVKHNLFKVAVVSYLNQDEIVMRNLTFPINTEIFPSQNKVF